MGLHADEIALAAVIDGYARFMRLVEEYVDLMTGITEEEAARAKDDE